MPVHSPRVGFVTSPPMTSGNCFGPGRFVVANVGFPPGWIPETDCFTFWKTEVQPHIASPSGARLDEYPGGYCYFAAEWVPADGTPVVVLEMAH